VGDNFHGVNLERNYIQLYKSRLGEFDATWREKEYDKSTIILSETTQLEEKCGTAILILKVL